METEKLEGLRVTTLFEQETDFWTCRIRWARNPLRVDEIDDEAPDGASNQGVPCGRNEGDHMNDFRDVEVAEDWLLDLLTRDQCKPGQ